MFDRGERVFWIARGVRRLGIVEESPPESLKARVRPGLTGGKLGAPEELPVRRLFRAPPELGPSGRFLQRDHSTAREEVAFDLERREASFVASDGTVDRFGDILEPDGWDLTAYRRNPVFLWNHDTSQPIGTVPTVAVRDGRLIARAKFIDQGISELADRLFRLVEKGLLCAVSIGARALAEPEPIRDDNEHVTGFRYEAMELLELSLVSVPANPNALLLGRSMGLEEEFLSEAFESVDASVANLDAYFTALRASVPGLLPPRPAKSSALHRGEHETDIRPDCRARQNPRGEGCRTRGAPRQSGE